MSKKGKSAAEKKEILLKIIRTDNDNDHGVVFNLKELEKLAGKVGRTIIKLSTFIRMRTYRNLI